MKQYEFTARTESEAIEQGLQELGVSIADVDVQVVEEGSKGLFGLFGSRPVKVRLTLKDAEEDPLADLLEEKPAKKTEKKAEKAEKKVEKKAEKKVEKPAVTEAICTVWNIRTTPRKVRLVCDVVRGKSVAEALGILSRLNKAASLPVAKAIKSAAANAVNNFGMQENLLYVAEIQASDGLRIKRFIPRAKGSASGLVKRNANLRVIVKEAK